MYFMKIEAMLYLEDVYLFLPVLPVQGESCVEQETITLYGVLYKQTKLTYMGRNTYTPKQTYKWDGANSYTLEKTLTHGSKLLQMGVNLMGANLYTQEQTLTHGSKHQYSVKLRLRLCLM